ncbi:hypothetical protein [Nonomuraea fuscirosea]|uniref:hypothetical protein n=1 Tax=Nonomuraea fuscirosea TaxID=1291556 RepID=UPI0034177191
MDDPLQEAPPVHVNPSPAAAQDETAPPDPRVRLDAVRRGTLRPLTVGNASVGNPVTGPALGIPDGGGAGVLAAAGRIEEMPVVAFAVDPRVRGGAMGAAGCEAHGRWGRRGSSPGRAPTGWP